MKQVLVVILMFLSFNLGFSQKEEAIKEIENFLKEQNEFFKDPVKSPLPKEDRANFESLNYFPVDLNLRVEATFVKAINGASIQMETSTTRKAVYLKYGELHFKIDEKPYVLNVYQNEKLLFIEEYKDYLFLPFTDKTSGESTYGGGRYIDMRIPKSDKVILDFNQSYNPYCAYGGNYSCPIPPAENYLDIAIEAGVKDYQKN